MWGVFAHRASKLAFCGTHSRKFAFHSWKYHSYSQLSNLLRTACCSTRAYTLLLASTLLAEAEVEVEAYRTSSLTAPASWLSAALIPANLHFILGNTIHTPN